MAEIEDQVAAWADAAAPEGRGGSVSADEVMAMPPPAQAAGPARWWRAVAAAAVVLAVVGLAVAVIRSDDDAEPIRADQPTTTTTATTTTTTAPDGPFADVDPSIGFEVLHVGPAPAGRATGLRSAQTQEQFDALWSDATSAEQPADAGPPDGLVPQVDLARQVVVGITVPEAGCPLVFVGFEQWASSDRTDLLVPRFRAGADDCDEPVVHREHLIALEWATLADRTWVSLPADPSAEGAGPGPEDHQIQLDRERPETVIADLLLDETELPGGSPLTGTLTVSNRSGEPIAYSYCGAEFALGLENEEVRQTVGFLDCLRGEELDPGTTSFPIGGSTSYGACTTSSLQPGDVECLEGGRLPPLPPGEYRTVIYPPAGLEGVEVPSVDVTVTEP